MELLKKCLAFLAIFCVLNQSNCVQIPPLSPHAVWVQKFAASYSGGVWHSPIKAYAWQWMPAFGHYLDYYVIFRAWFGHPSNIRVCRAGVHWQAGSFKRKRVTLKGCQ